MSYERKTTVITTEEFYFITRDWRRLEEDERNRVIGYVRSMIENPFTAAVRENRKRHPERFFVDAEISDNGLEVRTR